VASVFVVTRKKKTEKNLKNKNNSVTLTSNPGTAAEYSFS